MSIPTTVTKRAILVWAAACAVYMVAVTGRTSFGVAGVDALDRFGISAGQLAVFASVQVGVYSLSQIPVGMAIDKFGAKPVMLLGALVMAIGQAVLGFTTSYGTAIGARVLIGAGDATAFLAAMRLIPVWFPPRRAPLFAQFTGSIGQAGQFLSAVPFLATLHHFGWTPAFVGLGAVGLLVVLAAAIFVSEPTVTRAAKVELRPVVRKPIVWTAFFIHWTNMVPNTVLLLLWGVPIMSLGMGLSPAQIAVVLSITTAVTVAAGPVHGMISSRLGLGRNRLAFAVSVLMIGYSVVFFASPTPRGETGALVMFVLMALSIAASSYGFDTVRETVELEKLGTATGLANMGGFLATMIAAQAMGAVLDAVSDGGDYTWADFRTAWWAVVATWAFGMVLGLVFLYKSRGVKSRHATSSGSFD